MCGAQSAGLMVPGVRAVRIANNPPTPSNDIATTNSPATAPPRSATCSAPLSDVIAAAAVRMLARTAVHIPTNPAIPELSAPSRNDTVTYSASMCGSLTGSLGFGRRRNA